MLLNNYNINEETIYELGCFAVLWANFERDFCNNNCDEAKINNVATTIIINEESIANLHRVANNRTIKLAGSVNSYVNHNLLPSGARHPRPTAKEKIRNFINNYEGNEEGCLLYIYRIRNNLMHGLKDISDLNNQIELFKAINEVLENIKRK